MSFLIPVVVAFCLVGVYLLIENKKGGNKKRLKDLPNNQQEFAISKYYSANNLPKKSFTNIINSPSFLNEFAEQESNQS